MGIVEGELRSLDLVNRGIGLLRVDAKHFYLRVKTGAGKQDDQRGGEKVEGPGLESSFCEIYRGLHFHFFFRKQV